VRPDDRGRGLHAAPVRRAGRRQAAARAGERPGGLAAVAGADPRGERRAGALLPPHRRRSPLTRLAARAGPVARPGPQLTAFFTSAPILASSAAVSSVRA